jgi:hypothetical protein
MKKFIALLLIFSGFSVNAQIHNRLLKFNIGVSLEQFSIANTIKVYNDTSGFDNFNRNYTLPMVSISEEFTLNQLFSITGTIGFQNFNIKYNNQKYYSNLFFASVNPQLTVFYKAGFEYYVKLKVGVAYRQGDLTSIPQYSQAFFPEKANFFTGLTFAGLNFFFHDNWGANMELSLWSPQLVNVGLTYRFFKGEMPKNVPENGFYYD